MRLPAQVDTAEALRYLGWGGQPLDDDLAARLDRAAQACGGLEPRGAFASFPLAGAVDGEDGEPCAVLLAGTSFALEGRAIAEHLAGAREAALLAVTLGLESERLLRREQALSAVDGMLADACASSLVESAADSLSRAVAEDASARGLHAGPRFSPGYGDFPLDAQRGFVRALGADKALGISVTDGCLLVPAKSVTAVVGLFDRPPDAADPEGAASRPGDCASCRLRERCLLRSQGRTCHARS